MTTPAARFEKQEKACKSIARKAVDELKRGGTHIGEVEIFHHEGTWNISIENSEKDVEVLAHHVHKHSEAILLEQTQHDGHYDWAAEVYFKPYGMVALKF